MTETTHEALLRQTAATEEILDYFQGQRAGFRADVAQAQADYDGFADDLIDIAQSQMEFIAIIDSTASNPSNVNGGTFLTMKEAVDAAAAGSFVRLRLRADVAHRMDDHINLNSKTLYIEGHGGDAHVDVATNVGSAHNAVISFTAHQFGSIVIRNVTWAFDILNNGQSYSDSRYLFRYSTGIQWQIILDGSGLTGEGACGFSLVKHGAFTRICIRNTVLDGNIAGMTVGASGAAVLIVDSVTTTNGAVVRTGGTLGENLLSNE